MEIFADSCVHSEVVETLRQAGFKVERAIERKLEQSSDEEVFNYVLKTSKVLLTFDHDFGNILRFNIRRSPGVVIFYIENLSRKTITQRVLDFFSQFKEKNLKGKLCIIDVSGQIRIWPKSPN